MPDSAALFEYLKASAANGTPPEVVGVSIAQVLGLSDIAIGDTYGNPEGFEADRAGALSILDGLVQALQDLRHNVSEVTPETLMGAALGGVVGPLQALLRASADIEKVQVPFLRGEA